MNGTNFFGGFMNVSFEFKWISIDLSGILDVIGWKNDYLSYFDYGHFE